MLRLDRLGRSVKNIEEVVVDPQRRDVGLRAVSTGSDTVTPGSRLFFHMPVALAEDDDDDRIVERTPDGLAAARARYREGGRRSKMTAITAAQARETYDTRQHTVRRVAETSGATRGTVYRHLTVDTSA